MEDRGVRDTEGHGREGCDYRRTTWGNSLAVQWLGLGAFTAKGLGRSLVGELRTPQATRPAEKEKKKNRRITWMILTVLEQNLVHTHTHKVHVKVRKSEQDQWIVLMSIFWMWYYSFSKCYCGGNYTKFPSDLSILFLKTADKSISQ